ncbi:MAG: hypothetical protein Q8K57_13325 [Thiobacillus sp.]|nr:hypothetical protein [Thiobacillus sp.]
MEITAKLMALDIAVLALLSEHSQDAKFWERIERFSAFILQDPSNEVPPHLADQIQDQLDSWRLAAGPDSERPAPG